MTTALIEYVDSADVERDDDERAESMKVFGRGRDE